MSQGDRILQYGNAINEALRQVMSMDEEVVLVGQGVKSPWYVGSTCTGLLEQFGEKRVIDTPVSENAMTGAAIGAAIAGIKSVVLHPRMDFMLYAMDPILNEAANWRYMTGGHLHVPTVIWGIINRKGEQAAQHSQALHALFAHAPGLKVVMPSTPSDAKGLMVAAINDEDPVVFVDDRELYAISGRVPEDIYETPIGRGIVRKEGSDITIAAASAAAVLAGKAAEELEAIGISAEVVDLRTLKPLDEGLLLSSVRKTGRALVVDGGWRSFGASAEIAATVAAGAFSALRAPVRRLALPDVPAPASASLERAYYFTSTAITKTVKAMVSQE